MHANEQIQSTLAITDLVVPETLLYRTLPNLNCAYQPISPCYNGRTMCTGPDEFFKIHNLCYHTNNPCYNGKKTLPPPPLPVEMDEDSWKLQSFKIDEDVCDDED